MDVCVLSADELFASMLCSELEDIKENLSVYVNQYREGSIVILDLDSDVWSSNISPDDYIIGFSRNETDLPKGLLNKCYSIMHRPFLVEDMKNAVKKLAAKRAIYMSSVPENSTDKAEQSESERLRFDRECVYLDEKRVGLSGNEYAVLKLLYDNLTLPVSREEICRVISSSDGNICDVYICRLRSKLEKGGSEKLIFTVRGKGYMLKI